MKRLNQSGSHVVAIALVVLALGVVGFAGYTVQQSQHKSTVASKTASQQAAPETITSTADLQQAGQSLDDSSAELGTSLDDSALNGDLDSML